jgi:hypothetical protein
MTTSSADDAARPGLKRIIESGALWVVAFGSVLLWLALSADFENGLWWAWKTPGPGGVTYAIRQDKVVICLAWSLSVLILVAWRFALNVRGVLASLAFALLLLIGTSAVQISDAFYSILFRFVGGPRAGTWLGVIGLSIFLAKTWLPMHIAYLTVARDRCPRRHVALATAVILGACALMFWVGLYSLLHPGVAWRPAVHTF